MRAAGLGLVLTAGFWAALWSPAATAHIVYGTKTIHGFVAESDLVLRARIAAVNALPVPHADPAAAPESTGDGRPGVEAEVLEVLKGRYEAPRVRFAQHGHGVVQFEPGSETLLFLVDVARSRELDALGRQGRYAWVSLQEHQDEYSLATPTRAVLLTAVRAYVAADAAPPGDARLANLRRANRALLTSGDPELASSALRELVLAPDDRLLGANDLPALLAVVDAADTSMGVRAALLTELGRRGLVDPAPVWLRLLADETPPGDRVTAIRAVAMEASAAVRVRLVALLGDPDERVAAEAALALGVPGNAEAVEDLAKALGNGSTTVRMAAIRGLGRIGTPDAMAVLKMAAVEHADPATRRRAGAEVRKRGGEVGA